MLLTIAGLRSPSSGRAGVVDRQFRESVAKAFPAGFGLGHHVVEALLLRAEDRDRPLDAGDGVAQEGAPGRGSSSPGSRAVCRADVLVLDQLGDLRGEKPAVSRSSRMWRIRSRSDWS
jgi:hypothetical protein